MMRELQVFYTYAGTGTVEVPGRPLTVLYSNTHTYGSNGSGIEIHYEKGRSSTVKFILPGASVEDDFKYLSTLVSPPLSAYPTTLTVNSEPVMSVRPGPSIIYHVYWRQS